MTDKNKGFDRCHACGHNLVEDESPAPYMFTISQVAAQLGMSRSQLQYMIKHERFPPPFRLSARCTRWSAEDIQAFIQTRRPKWRRNL